MSMSATSHLSLHYISQTNKGVKSDTMFGCNRPHVVVSKKKCSNRLCTGKSEMRIKVHMYCFALHCLRNCMIYVYVLKLQRPH